MVVLPEHVSLLLTQDALIWLTALFSDLILTPGPKGSQSLYWFLESTPTKSFPWSYHLAVTLPLRKITGLHTDPGSPGTLGCQAPSCPNLTHYILCCNHQRDLEIGVFAYLYVWMQYLVATSTCAYSSFRGLVLCFTSQKLLPYKFFEKGMCRRMIYQFFFSLFSVLMPCCDVALSWEALVPIVGWTGWTQGLKGSGFPSNNNPAREATLLIHHSCLFYSALNNRESEC